MGMLYSLSFHFLSSTPIGLFKSDGPYDIRIDVRNVRELSTYSVSVQHHKALNWLIKYDKYYILPYFLTKSNYFWTNSRVYCPFWYDRWAQHNSLLRHSRTKQMLTEMQISRIMCNDINTTLGRTTIRGQAPIMSCHFHILPVRIDWLKLFIFSRI